MQTAILLLCGLAVAGAAALLASLLFLGLTDVPFELPVRALAVLVGAAVRGADWASRP